MKKIILASRSKRRSAILKSCNIPHTVVPSRVAEEEGDPGRPSAAVLRNARIKAEAVARKGKKSIVIGIDTLVLFKKKLVGKPRTRAEARIMLKAFSGNRISVYSGICVIDSGVMSKAWGYDKTTLYIEKIPGRDIDKYFRLLGPYDKAGGFSIEGAGSIVFDNVRGSYFNVLGLPMWKLQELFRKIGLDLLDYVKQC
ncbi:MAG: septum formation protein Maf [Candidatus Omnitrophica bacterium]|nr:septum formation protein Maf [Candidatus Omnitrophota bacterium]